MDPSDSRQYWIDASVQKALETLFMHGIYNARIIHHADRHDQVMHGMKQVEEIISPITSPVAVYISRFNTYNEKDCRAICREITTCIQIMHEAGIAHRNLHLANVEIDPFVRFQLYFIVLFRVMKWPLNFIFINFFREKLV